MIFPIQDKMLDALYNELDQLCQQIPKEFPGIDMGRLTYNRSKIRSDIEDIREEIDSKITKTNSACKGCLLIPPGEERTEMMRIFVEKLVKECQEKIRQTISEVLVRETQNYVSAIKEWENTQKMSLNEQKNNITRAIAQSDTQMRGKQDAIAEAQYRLGCSEIILAQIMQK